MYILGISAFYHDSAACIIKDGIILAAAQEERFTRIKHDPSFPHNAIKFCIEEANINGNEISNVVFYEKPFVKFERILETYLAFAPKGFYSFSKAMPIWIKDKLFQKSILIKELEKTIDKNVNWQERLLFSEHHLSHAASAYYPSPFDSAAIIVLDGVGEWTTTSIAVGEGKNLNIIKEIKFPHSLGLLYSAFTYYTGFKVNSGEYKVMGLAPYGEPKYTKKIKDELINISDDGSFQLNMDYFDYPTGLKMTNNNFSKLFDGAPRIPESQLTQRDMDLAASVQKVTEEVLVKIAKRTAKDTGKKNLCLAGGVALNCVANSILLEEKIFDNIWVQPAAGDAGGAIGAAFCAWHLHYKKSINKQQKKDALNGSYIGPSFNNDKIEAELLGCGAKFEKINDNEIIKRVVNSLSDQKIVGWMHGRMEFGPRALGSRSIIADPRSSSMQKELNLKIKFRESFRPFAPSILREDINNWFDNDFDSPYMTFVSKLKSEKRISITEEEKKLKGFQKLNVKRSIIPSVTHVDYTSRVQTVHANTNPLYYNLIRNFKEKTGCPILLNTSFNIRGEPIVCTPTDAFKCFMGTEIDVLSIGNYFLLKDKQDQNLINNYKNHYELD